MCKPSAAYTYVHLVRQARYRRRLSVSHSPVLALPLKTGPDTTRPKLASPNREASVFVHPGDDPSRKKSHGRRRDLTGQSPA